MLKLQQICDYYRKRYKDNHKEHNVIVYPSFNAMTAFIKEPRTKCFIILSCISKNLRNNRKFKISNMKDKTPLEILQEAYYYHRINYVPTAFKGTELKKLATKNKLNSIFENKVNGRQLFSTTFKVDSDSKIIPSLNRSFRRILSFYEGFIKNPKTYFIIKDMRKRDKKSIKKERQKIYDLDFKK